MGGFFNANPASMASLADASKADFSTVSTPRVIFISKKVPRRRRGKRAVHTRPSFQL